MATVQEYLDLFYPYLSVTGDPRYAEPEVQALAVMAAISHRPKCLSEDQQNQAQAHYAAYILYMRYSNKSNANGVTIRPMYVEQEQQGDTIIKYATGMTGAASASPGPITPYDAYKALARICTRGAILTRFS